MIVNINDEILSKYINYKTKNVLFEFSDLYKKYIIPNGNLVYPLLEINHAFDTSLDEDVVILKYCLANNLLEQRDLDDLNEFLIANL